MKVTFAKLKDGAWGLRVKVGQGESVSMGEVVTVEKADGSTTEARVGRILWSGDDRDDPNGKVALCAIARKAMVAA